MIDNAEGRRLVRYLAGECSPREAGEVRAWIAADPARGRMFDELAQVWQTVTAPPGARDAEIAWREFVAVREARHVRPLHTQEGDRAPMTVADRWYASRPRSVWWAGIAAAVVVLAVAGTRWHFAARGTTRAGQRAAATLADSTQVYATRRGERAEVRLPDGSRVRLGVDSRLSVPADFGTTIRAVSLVGEAAFEVVHDTARPFRVRAAGTVTEDLGTTFGVRAYVGDPVRVIVAEGAVAVRDTVSRAAVVLRPRDLALVSGDGKIAVERDVDPEAYLAWTTGRLVFRYSAFADVVKELERQFDVRVTVDDPALSAAKVSATFDDSSLDDILSVLARTLDARVERRGHSILVRPRD